MSKKFVSTMRKGFHMTFENGLTASVQWGCGNYCDNHFDGNPFFNTDAESNTAEVAVFNEKMEFINANDFVPDECQSPDDVCGYMTPEQVVDFLYAVKTAKPIR